MRAQTAEIAIQVWRGTLHAATNAKLGLQKKIPAFLAAALSLLVACLSAGCIVIPMRAPSRTIGASANTRDKIDLSFIQAGTTTRQEVLQKLDWMDTGVADERLFLGRWASSNWGVFWAAAGNLSAAGDWNRSWQKQNLLVEFDQNGLVRQYRVFPDKQLASELSAIFAQSKAQPLDLAPPIEMTLPDSALKKPHYRTLVLGKDAFEIHEVWGKKKLDISIPPSQIKGLALASNPLGAGSNPDPHYVFQTIFFNQKTRAGKTITIWIDLPTAVIFFRYFAQTHPISP